MIGSGVFWIVILIPTSWESPVFWIVTRNARSCVASTTFSDDVESWSPDGRTTVETMPVPCIRRRCRRRRPAGAARARSSSAGSRGRSRPARVRVGDVDAPDVLSPQFLLGGDEEEVLPDHVARDEPLRLLGEQRASPRRVAVVGRPAEGRDEAVEPPTRNWSASTAPTCGPRATSPGDRCSRRSSPPAPVGEALERFDQVGLLDARRRQLLLEVARDRLRRVGEGGHAFHVAGVSRRGGCPSGSPGSRRRGRRRRRSPARPRGSASGAGERVAPPGGPRLGGRGPWPPGARRGSAVRPASPARSPALRRRSRSR